MRVCNRDLKLAQNWGISGKILVKLAKISSLALVQTESPARGGLGLGAGFLRRPSRGVHSRPTLSLLVRKKTVELPHPPTLRLIHRRGGSSVSRIFLRPTVMAITPEQLAAATKKAVDDALASQRI